MAEQVDYDKGSQNIGRRHRRGILGLFGDRLPGKRSKGEENQNYNPNISPNPNPSPNLNPNPNPKPELRCPRWTVLVARSCLLFLFLPLVLAVFLPLRCLQGFLTHQVQSGRPEGRNSRHPCPPAGGPVPKPFAYGYTLQLYRRVGLCNNPPEGSQSCLATTRIITRQPAGVVVVSLPYIPPQLIGAMASTLPIAITAELRHHHRRHLHFHQYG